MTRDPAPLAPAHRAPDRGDVLTRRLVRGSVVGVAALSLAAIVLGLLPGVAVYEGGALVGRRPAGGASVALLATWLAVPGIVVWLHPRPLFAFAWSLLGWAGSLLWTAAVVDATLARVTAELAAGQAAAVRVELLWPATAVAAVLWAQRLLLLVAIPLGACALGAAGRARARRDAPPPGPPAARIHRER